MGRKLGHDGGDGAIFHPDIGIGLVTADHNGQGGIFEKARPLLFSLGKPCEPIDVVDEYKCPGVDPREEGQRSKASFNVSKDLSSMGLFAYFLMLRLDLKISIIVSPPYFVVP